MIPGVTDPKIIGREVTREYQTWPYELSFPAHRGTLSYSLQSVFITPRTAWQFCLELPLWRRSIGEDCVTWKLRHRFISETVPFPFSAPNSASVSSTSFNMRTCNKLIFGWKQIFNICHIPSKLLAQDSL
jgi:hypothetical protein